MGSIRKIKLWLLAFLAFSCLAFVSPSKVIAASNILRIGTEEYIFVECQDCIRKEKVVISVKSHPAKVNTLASTSVTLTQENNYQALAKIIIPPKGLRKDPNRKQYVSLQATFSGVELEKTVLVSFQSGYMFIQTDKTLYTPNSKVHYRVFAMTPGLEPMEKNDESKTDPSIITELVSPDGIILPLEQVSLKSGIFSGNYKLGEMASPGLWKVVAKLLSSPQQSYSAEFEVKEYVLPSFEVQLSSDIAFFHVDSQDLTINIKATYLFGEELNGDAYVVFGIIFQGQKRCFPSSLQKVMIDQGIGRAILTREHITDTFPKIQKLVGSSIYVAATVLTTSGSEMVEAQLQDIQIVTSPFTIHFKKTPKYYKPGMSFDVMVEVVNPDGTPAQEINVVVEPGNVKGRTAANGMARLSLNAGKMAEPLTVTAKTAVPDVTQASASMIALPYATKNNSYIHIGVDRSEAKLGQNLKVSFILNKEHNAKNDLTYLILSRGQLVGNGKYEIRELTSMIVIITKELLPSFRIIAYYFTADNEVVSDSVWVDVTDSCIGSLKLEPKTPSSAYLPSKLFNMKVTGDPGATVGLVAVDKGVYVLNNKHRLTQKKVWDLVETYDTGCTPGGGKDSMGVFQDAGLLFMSDRATATQDRLELKCPVPTRRKRASTIMEVRTTLLSQYEDQLQRDCCLEGMMEIQLSYDCKRRSEYIVDSPVCAEAFLFCCNEIQIQQAERRQQTLLLARSEDTAYRDSSNLKSRSQFPESWLWTLLTLPACRQQNCESVMPFPMKDSITTWQFIGISLSRTHGICVADPLEVIVRKNFFIDLLLPYSAVRGEQIEIKAVIHNYMGYSNDVRVELISTEHVCSSASRRGKYHQDITVEDQTAQAVPFVIIPMKEGKHSIEVKAIIRDSDIYDGVLKSLLVVPNGVLQKSLQTVTLNPGRNGVDGIEEKIINSNIRTANLLPNSPTWTQVAVTGREQIGALLDNAISGKSLGTLIVQPSGCGEQNMIHMTLPVIATTYLDKTNQWETVGFDRRKEAIQHIETGYLNELHFIKADGSFSVFPHHKSSTWLTAYVAKVFAMSHSLVGAVKNKTICEAINFLNTNTQQDDGSFKEVGLVVHGEMIGDVLGKDSEVSMTAFCLIAMQESRTICSDKIHNFTSSIDKAVAYLQARLHSLNNPYAAAMTSYALANENKLDRQILFKFASSDSTHWPVHDATVFTLEATAYALLALIKAKAFEEAKPVVRWFSQQQSFDGNFGSTQATIMVYQAIAEYWVSASEEEYDVNVDIGIPTRQKPERFNFNRATHYTTRTSKFSNINQNVTLTATGNGEATVRMVSLYYAQPTNSESDCQKFNLSVRLTEQMFGNELTYKLEIKFSFLMNAQKKLLSGSIRSTKWESYNQLLCLSMNTTSINTLNRTFVLSFTIQREVVEKYSGSVAVMSACVLKDCSMQKTEKISNEERIAKACETTKESQIDFVYRVRLENVSQHLSTDIYSMRVMEVIKGGSYDECQGNLNEGGSQKICDEGPLGNLRPFLSLQHCSVTLNLQIGKTYLVMGMAKDIHKVGGKAKYQYVLGERTWIEYWPSDEECQTGKYRDTCKGMERLQHVYERFGCYA